ncbi:hypothetical protein DFP72DRAFT_824538 [Ephemerocybe angulata]|uniref:DUF155 domain-containing protein n=1 Tax=Ephemerocybe angulata TaxID=980116 RepID=A0A8H6HEK1_9AGAR|nr:hypothetical protein DFP72DRAFT_824538 [Tulosesus angulatus]
MNLNRGRRRESGPQLQVARRSSTSRPATAISRLASSVTGAKPQSQGSAIRSATAETLSTSAPDSLDNVPLLASGRGQRAQNYGTLEESLSVKPKPTRRTSDSAAGTSRLLRTSSATPLPTTATHRVPSRSFLAASGSGNGAAGTGSTAAGKATMPSLPKHQRTSKTSQKLVVLPSAPQTKPMGKQLAEEEVSAQVSPEEAQPSKLRIRDYKSAAERMSKEERKKAGFKRMTAYCIAEGLNMKVLSGFLKREHNVLPRIFDEALYAMYHLPLLPGYGPQTNVRSSAPPPQPISASGSAPAFTKSILTRLEEAEETGYQGTYFPSQDLIDLGEPAETHHHQADGFVTDDGGPQGESASHLPGWVQPAEVDEVREHDGYVSSSSLPREQNVLASHPVSEFAYEYNPYPSSSSASSDRQLDNVGEVVFFDYGVVVFFGLAEREERDILDDIQQAGVLQRPIIEEEWEVEECHFAHDPNISYPRIYNDFFTLKSRSHLLKLSIAHALAQSTLLARYETIAQRTLSSPLTLSIPRQMASTGGLQLRRHEALKLTGRLFKLRRDVNLVSNVLDVPELFWSEASLEDLYDAVRDYMEIGPRVESLNEKLGVASDFLDVIHDHLNNSAMERITWIVIWLIVVAVLVELGEIVARLVVHSTLEKDRTALAAMRALTSASPTPLSKEEALRTLERIMNIQS